MTITVRLDDMSATSMLDIVRELKQQGYQLGQDFDFAFCPSKQYDEYPYDENKKPFANFMFYTEEMAFLFKLKYTRSK